MSNPSKDKYKLNETTEGQLWQNCIFIFDSSALLDLYYYPETTRQKIFNEIFEKTIERLWIPNHVKFEFLKNREKVIKKPIKEKYEPLIKDYLLPLQESIGKSQKTLNQLKQTTKNSDKHPYIESSDIEKFEKELKSLTDALQKFDNDYRNKITEKEKEIEDLGENDTVLIGIEKYFKAGREYSYSEIYQITIEGKHRYEFKIPPGYADQLEKDKEGFQIFGDLIIWKQIIEYAKKEKRNVVFVLNDLKKDWCYLDESATEKRIKSPREELIKEFHDETSCTFWMYNQEQFIYLANKYLSASFTKEQIQPVLETLSKRIERKLIAEILIDKTWRLNHWGSTCAKIEGDKMVFTGTSAPQGTDGSHKDLIRFLEIGATYEVTCFVKSYPGTQGEFQLWCHDKTGEKNGVSESTPYKVPDTEGETIGLIFNSNFNENIRIHLQYKPGQGQIEVSEIKIYKIDP